MKLSKIIELFNEHELITIVGYDKAVIGIDENNMRLIYDKEKMIKITMKNLNFDYLEAIEYLDYNVFNSNFNNSPIFLT